MSFDQDPNEQANISGADFAILCDELKTKDARIAGLEEENTKLHLAAVAAEQKLRNEVKKYDAKLEELERKLQFWKKSANEWKLAYAALGGTASESGKEELNNLLAKECENATIPQHHALVKWNGSYDAPALIVVESMEEGLEEGDVLLHNNQVEDKIAKAKEEGYQECQTDWMKSNIIQKAKEEGKREAVPEGWQVVPRTPDCTMLLAGKHTIKGMDNGEFESEIARCTFLSMLSAAPKPEGIPE